MERFASFKVFVVALLLVAYASSSAVWQPSAVIRAEDSCAGRCTQGTIPGAPCQCNQPCEEYGDCCADYVDLCTNHVSDKVLEDLTEELIQLDVANNATRYIGVNLQGRMNEDANDDANEDNAPNDLLNVSLEAFARPTIAKFVKLLDNYIPSQLETEDFTPEEMEEVNDFIDAVLATSVMQRAQQFLREKQFPNGRDSLYTLWFELYDRARTTNSSSGFEHVFVGELDNRGGVGGFHNWISFAMEEFAGRMEYLGYKKYADFLARGSAIEPSFDWRGVLKPISTMFIGTSPEFELALYTVCYHTRTDQKCPVSINGDKFKIQTYNLNSTYGQHVSTAYPDLSDYTETETNSAPLSVTSSCVVVFAICGIIVKYWN